MNRRTFIKACAALAGTVVVPKELELLPIPDELEFKSVSMWVDGVHISNIQVFDFALNMDQVKELAASRSYYDWAQGKDDSWHHIVIKEDDNAKHS